MPCLPLVRTVTLCARKLSDPECYDHITTMVAHNPRSRRLRELWLLEVPPAFLGDEDAKLEPDPLGRALNDLKEACRVHSVRINL